MDGDLHFEVVLSEKGHYRVYFTDAVRAELPASVASNLVITVTERSGVQAIKARIADDGKSWVAEGKPVRVLKMEGLKLYVEPVEAKASATP